jgi:signal transduction histidine kinase
MNRQAQQQGYAALLDDRGRVLAGSREFTARARADLSRSAALELIRAGHPYGLGNMLPYGKTGVINYAIAFPTPYGRRILLTGFKPFELNLFITGELRRIPGVQGAHNYLIDGNNVVLASTNPRIPPGRSLTTPAEVKALSHPSGDVQGHYYDQVPLTNSTWRIVLAAPDRPLFSSVSGLRKWVPWLIFAALVLVAGVAFLLATRVMKASDRVREVNGQLEIVNAELKTTNAALERRAIELARSNAELDQFASIASHDLQEPLRKVRTFTQELTVMEADHLSDKGREYLQRANRAAERMQKLIEDLLKFSRVATHAHPFGPVDLDVLMRETLDDLSAQIERTGATVIVGSLPTISADPLQMRQLLQNLISNALKFRRPEVAPEITIDATVAGDQARLTVRDNGIGFDPRYNRRIFRVFERLNGRGEYPGTGIGLALCRKIAERHGGDVVADSEPGVGSTFTVTLPLGQPDDPLLQAMVSSGGRSSEREEAGVLV